jgi:hypothetical protein
MLTKGFAIYVFRSLIPGWFVIQIAFSWEVFIKLLSIHYEARSDITNRFPAWRAGTTTLFEV